MISDASLQSLFAGAVAALVGALVGSTVPAWIASRRRTVGAIELLISELFVNESMLATFIGHVSQLPVGERFLLIAPRSLRLELRSVALSAATEGSASFRARTRDEVLRAYQFIERIERSVDRLHALHTHYLGTIGEATDRRAERLVLSDPNGAATQALALLEGYIQNDCSLALEAVQQALESLEAERKEFSEGRLW